MGAGGGRERIDLRELSSPRHSRQLANHTSAIPHACQLQHQVLPKRLWLTPQLASCKPPAFSDCQGCVFKHALHVGGPTRGRVYAEPSGPVDASCRQPWRQSPRLPGGGTSPKAISSFAPCAPSRQPDFGIWSGCELRAGAIAEAGRPTGRVKLPSRGNIRTCGIVQMVNGVGARIAPTPLTMWRFVECLRGVHSFCMELLPFESIPIPMEQTCAPDSDPLMFVFEPSVHPPTHAWSSPVVAIPATVLPLFGFMAEPAPSCIGEPLGGGSVCAVIP